MKAATIPVSNSAGIVTSKFTKRADGFTERNIPTQMLSVPLAKETEPVSTSVKGLLLVP